MSGLLTPRSFCPQGRQTAGLAVAVAFLLPTAAAGQAGGIGFGGIGADLGADPRVGNLRPQLEGYLNKGPPLAARPAWLLGRSIGVDIGATDNARQVRSPKQADIFTTITPSLSLDGDAARVKVNLSYSPEVTVYANTSSQNRVSQFLNGQAKAIIVPDAIFLDARASITQQSLTGGGYNQYQTQTYSRQNQVQTTTVSLSPSAQHHFGGWGDGAVSYTYSKTMQDTQTSAGSSTNNGLGTPGYGAPGNLSTNSEYASFTSGENLGRFQDQVLVTASQFDGSGSARGGYRQEVQNSLDFALTRAITLLSTVGYQQISYASSLNSGTTVAGTGYNYSGPTYSLGVRYAPHPRLSLSVRYGRHDGSTDASFSGQYQITARASLVASYSNGVTTDLQQSQTQLANTNVGVGGVLTDSTTGAPVRQNNYSATQNGVYRLNRFSASLIFLQERDSYSLSLTNDERTALTSSPTLAGNGVVAAGTATTTTSAGFSWQHDLAPDMSLSTYAQYGISTNTGQFVGSGNRDQRTITLSAILSKQLNETLSASLRYIYTDQTGGQTAGGTFNSNGFSNNGLNGGSFTQNTLLLGLRKSF